MPPKAKKGKKGKGKKGKGKKKEEEEVEETEFNDMDLEMLSEVVPMLKQQLEKSMLDRNYVQLERDTIQTFYDITKKEVNALEMAITTKDREMELMEDNHRVEVRVYVQKVKHLDYEHSNNLKQIGTEEEEWLRDEKYRYEGKEMMLKRGKKELKNEVQDRALLNAEEIASTKEANTKNLTKMRQGFDGNLDALKKRCGDRLQQLEEDLELRRKVGIHEIEERKNLHINDLMRNHERAFGQMKAYYNDITNDNLKLIKSLKDELTEMRKKAIANQKLMHDIAQENRRLSEPLAIALAEVSDLRAALKDQDKDRLSLSNARARLRKLQEELKELGEVHQEKLIDFANIEHERDALYDTFEDSIRSVQEKSDFKNLLLEQRLEGMENGIERDSLQLQEIVAAAQLDVGEVQHLMSNLDEVLSAKNTAIRDLQYQVMRCAKAYNDSLRTYSQKLVDIGIPQQQIKTMGFVPVSSANSTGPAGLVVK